MNNENKLIAEFMGRTITFDIVDNDTYRGEVTLSKGLIEEQIEPEISHFEDRYSVTPIAIEENLLYHEDWNWLMKVVDKIESLGYSYDRINADVFINNQNGENVIPNPMDENTMTMIEKTYYVVGEFIKQYNRTDGK